MLWEFHFFPTLAIQAATIKANTRVIQRGVLVYEMWQKCHGINIQMLFAGKKLTL